MERIISPAERQEKRNASRMRFGRMWTSKIRKREAPEATAHRTYALLYSSSVLVFTSLIIRRIRETVRATGLYQLDHPQNEGDCESHHHGGNTVAPSADENNEVGDGRNGSNRIQNTFKQYIASRFSLAQQKAEQDTDRWPSRRPSRIPTVMTMAEPIRTMPSVV